MKRNIKNEPFAWTNKSSWELIETLPFKKQMSCKMIYVALSIASKKQQNSSLLEIYKFDIARYGSISEKTVQRYLPELEKLGLIKVEPQDRESNGKFKKCRIWLYDSILSAGQMEDSCETDERQMEDTESDIYKQKNKQEQKNKNIYTKSEFSEYPDKEFSEIINFWNGEDEEKTLVCRRVQKNPSCKVGKRIMMECKKITPSIEKAYKKLKKDYTLDDFIHAITQYAIEIVNRQDDRSENDYCSHRFSLNDFFTQKNAFIKFVNYSKEL